MKDKILKTIENHFNLGALTVAEFERSDLHSGNRLFILSNEKDERFFYKEIPSHSVSGDLETIYEGLSNVRPINYKLALPMKNIFGKYISYINNGDTCERPFVVMSFVEHQNVQESRFDLKLLLQILAEFHRDIKNVMAPEKPDKTYESFLQRGLYKIQFIFPNHPFCKMFDDFLKNRFPKLQLNQGVIHGDCNPFNVWISKRNGIYFSDFDNLQKGHYIKDLSELVAGYLNVEEKNLAICKEIKFLIQESAAKTAGPISWLDLKYLIVRPLLPDIFDSSSLLAFNKKQMALNNITEFLSANEGE